MATSTFDQFSICNVNNMRDPFLQAVKDVCGVDDGRSALFTFLFKEPQQIQAPNHVHVHCHLIQ